MNIVIGGSYHKFLEEINKIHDRLERNGHKILAPLKSARASKVDSKYNYILFQGEEEKNPVNVQKKFLKQIRKADAFVICNKNGYMGQTVAAEMGWAYAAIKDKKFPLKQMYLTDSITLLDTLEKKGRISIQDVKDDSQLQYYKKYYNMTEEEIRDQCEFILIHIAGYKSEGVLTVGIDKLLEKEKMQYYDEGR